jgi:hypothetical protein
MLPFIIKDKNNNVLCKIDENHINTLKEKIEKLDKKNCDILYVLLLHNSCENKKSRIKIGWCNNMNNFIKANGRFQTHANSFNFENVILYNVFEIYNRKVESLIHRKLRKFKKRTMYNNYNTIIESNETYKCRYKILDSIKELVKDFNRECYEDDHNILTPADYLFLNNQLNEGIIKPIKKLY